VSDNPNRWEIVEAWKQAALDCGFSESEDFNRGTNDGVGYYQATIRNGRRWSASRAFLRPVMFRPNLRILTNSHVKSLRFNGKRCAGVEFWRDDTLCAADASGEVILAAGAIGSPQLLQVSGIGPSTLLSQHGIPTVLELPGVGENMQDHWVLRLTFRASNTVTMNEWVNNPLRRYVMGAYYLATRRGPMGFTVPQMGLHAPTNSTQESANVQLNISPATSDRMGGPLHSHPGMSCVIVALRPPAVGYCRIKSADPQVHPSIRHNFLETTEAQRRRCAEARANNNRRICACALHTH